MNYLQKLDLIYADIPPGENLYDNLDLSVQDLVEAQYWTRNGHLGNPDICALPRPADVEEIKTQNSVPIAGYNRERMKDMPVYERKRNLFLLKTLRYPFPFHSQVESYLSMSLLSSYSARKAGVTELYRPIKLSGKEENLNILSCSEAVSANVLGFSIVGTSGTGKSTAFDMACKKYPRAIRHNFSEGSYIQIPIVRLTAYANSNLTALFYSFARQLDRILDTGNDHLTMLQGKTNLGRIASILCGWIELYHIGVIAIDEIQFLDFSEKSAKSFENFLTITANTGVALVTIGTPDACRLWGSTLRIQRRIGGNIVRADSYCKDRRYMEVIVQKLWKYQWLDNPMEITQEIADAMYEESMGSIDLLTSLWMMVQFEALCKKQQPVVDAAFIRKVSGERFKDMRELLFSELVESERKFLDLRESLFDGVRRAADADEERCLSESFRREAEENVRLQYDRDLILGETVETIQCCNPELSEQRIKKAFAKAEKEEGFKALRKKERIQKVLATLKKSEPGKRKTQKKSLPQLDGSQMKLLENSLKQPFSV